MSAPAPVTTEEFNRWADDPQGPVALHLRQKLLPVEGADGVIFPPTYADIGYNIDELSDGTKVATIDSVGSQANRMEPIFKHEPYAALVPQIDFQLGNEKTVSIFDVGHRLGDALVRASDLAKDAEEAFQELQRGNDPTRIAKLAPTSLVFGVWDSRGEGSKVPRVINAIIRAHDVDVLHRAATYLPATDFTDDALLGSHADEKAEKDARSALGFQHAPATWTANERVQEYRDGKPNPDRRILGGIIARGGVYRDVTVNLIAIRRLGGPSARGLRRYILGLSLAAAAAHADVFLRQGCLLTFDPKQAADWTVVERSGHRRPVLLGPEDALDFAAAAAKDFVVGPPKTAKFDAKRARQLVDEQKGGKKRPSRKRGSVGSEGDREAASAES